MSLLAGSLVPGVQEEASALAKCHIQVRQVCPLLQGPNADSVSPRTPSYHTSSHSLSAAVTQRTLFFFFFCSSATENVRPSGARRDKRRCQLGRGRSLAPSLPQASRTSISESAQGRIASMFLTCLGLLTRGRSHSPLLHSSPQKAALCCDLLLAPVASPTPTCWMQESTYQEPD